MCRLKFYSLVFYFSIGGAITSCQKVITDKAALFEYLTKTEHGLKKANVTNKIKVEVTYYPWQLVEQNQNKRVQKEVERGFADKCYFVLAFSANGKELLRQLPYSEYSEMVQVFSFRMQPNISIVTDAGKKVEAQDCLFEQTYGMGKENELLIVFDKRKLQDATTLKLRIKEFGLNIGNQDFQIRVKDINDMPEIKII